MVRWPALKAQKTDGSTFMGAKAWVFGFQIDNQLRHLLRETGRGLRGRGTLRWKEGTHPLSLKPLGLVGDRAFARARFFGTFSRRLTVEDHRANFFIDLLLRPEGILLDLLPVVGTFSALTLARRHGDHLFGFSFSSPTDRSVCPDLRNVYDTRLASWNLPFRLHSIPQ